MKATAEWSTAEWSTAESTTAAIQALERALINAFQDTADLYGHTKSLRTTYGALYIDSLPKNGLSNNGGLLKQSVIWSIIQAILWYRPLKFLYGFEALKSTLVHVSLFHLSPSIEIIVRLQSWPEKCFTSNHHRRGIHQVDLLSQFILASMYRSFTCITEMLGNMELIQSLKTFTFHEKSLVGLTTEEKFATLASTTSDCTSVWPDKDGSLCFQDRSMYFRDGLFSASYFLQTPIIDLVVLEPTSVYPRTSFVYTRWDPPHACAHRYENTEAYIDWYKINKSIIKAYALDCENKFKTILEEFEALRACCNAEDQYSICASDEEAGKIQRALMRNKRLSHVKY